MAASTTPNNPVDIEILEYFTHLTREADLQVFGRKTYQLMVPYWPDVAQGPVCVQRRIPNSLEPLSPPTKWFFRDP